MLAHNHPSATVYTVGMMPTLAQTHLECRVIKQLLEWVEAFMPDFSSYTTLTSSTKLPLATKSQFLGLTSA